jgi:tripartite-type tricarboxylate transporter receptor subunit TctC
MKRNGLLATILAAAALASTATLGQHYPDRPIRIIAGFSPGGAPDVTARVLAHKLADTLGQPVVVENRPGANSTIAGQFVAKASPDGYTLLLGNDTLFAVNPHIYRMAFDPLQDLAPIASVVSNQFYISVHPSLPPKNLKEFIEYARKADPPLIYGSAGNGSMHHLSMEMLKQRAGINLMHVPYRGGAAAATAAIAGEVQVTSAGASSAPQIEAGLLRGLATTGRLRSALFPNLPAIAEFYPGFDATIWLGLFAPVSTPQHVVATLRNAVNEVLAMADVQKRLRSAGMEPNITDIDVFTQLIRSDHQKYGKLISDLGLRQE